GRLVDVGHEVTERWTRALDGLLERRLIPSLVGRDAHGNEPRSGHPNRVERVWVARRLDKRAVASGEQGTGNEGDRVLGADRDHDLVRVGGKAARGVSPGDRIAQLGQAERVETAAAEVG